LGRERDERANQGEDEADCGGYQFCVGRFVRGAKLPKENDILLDFVSIIRVKAERFERVEDGLGLQARDALFPS